MNLYEEFGLSASATPDQIRQAHRTMARLLHPDNFQDEELRQLAECQMKRINGIYTVLADPQSRQQYNRNMTSHLDRELALGIVPVNGLVRWRENIRGKASLDVLRRNIVWVVATVVCVFGIYWLLSTQASSPVAAQPYTAHGEIQRPEKAIVTKAPVQSRQSRNEPLPQAVDPDEVRQLARETKQLRQMLEQAMAERDIAVSRLAALLPSPSIPSLATATSLPAVEPVSGSAAVPPPARPQQKANLLTGTWVYLASNRTPGDLYPAEYIELIISHEGGHEGGMLLGRYRGRYRVADRAISPEVQFVFEGQADGTSRFQWTGNGGAKGEVELKRLSDNALSVVWHTLQFGRQLSLSSGTAVLVRRQEQ
ncbi:MAG: J domain-containing protein [Acidobacteriia bacterium]|nr:J domain-containing protein [Terriglobia bacterium]